MKGHLCDTEWWFAGLIQPGSSYALKPHMVDLLDSSGIKLFVIHK